ncbi:hypothetical protein Acsp02_36020 [Actinoplanes sp. NBRC 103695]|nr:hypothetical protein Acsp02_36020 [Actinoplanes sp. NBRC 103695]
MAGLDAAPLAKDAFTAWSFALLAECHASAPLRLGTQPCVIENGFDLRSAGLILGGPPRGSSWWRAKGEAAEGVAAEGVGAEGVAAEGVGQKGWRQKGGGG